MKTLMYPIAPEDDFPEMFCAIRQGSGEHTFYTPEGESASWMLFRAESENAKLREDLEDQEGYDQMLRDRLRQQTELCVKAKAENQKLRAMLDFALPIAMYAASTEEGDRIRELMREVEL